MIKKSGSLFRRLIWSVAIPEFIIFLIVGWVSYGEMKRVLKEKNQQQSEALRSEISGLLDFQNFSIGMIEGKLNNRLELASWELRELYFSTSDSIEHADLKSIRSIIGLDSNSEEIDIIRKDGITVNTTNIEDIGLNTYEYGEAFKQHIKSVLADDEFTVEEFTVNVNSKKLIKWSYQSTNDHNYVIQIHVVSNEVNALSEAVQKIISKISDNRKEVVSMDIFVNPDQPYSFASDVNLSDEESSIISSIFKKQQDSVFSENLDDREIETLYIYSEREGSLLANSFVVRLKKDRTLEKDLLRNNLLRKIGLFALGLLVLFVILLINTNFITSPIKLVSSAARSIGSGLLSKRVPVMGTVELKGLAESFNQMASDLEMSDQKIRSQKAKIEEAHGEIKDSITYAKRIQAAILPPSRLVKEYLTNSFVLYKPKDIVAGDFYWMEVTENALLFAAADCTGHGVPGAMISVVCHNALNRSVREYGLTDPGLILNKTREIVIEEFEKSDEEVMDGMDVALCGISGYKLQYSGAHNPLWIVRNGELMETKGNKQPIGIYDELKAFDTHSFDLIAGDTIYIFSDGYVDQFGGEKGKKFMSARFKRLILSIQSETMEKQKLLLDEAFETWRGDEDQIDDVCVIGVRV